MTLLVQSAFSKLLDYVLAFSCNNETSQCKTDIVVIYDDQLRPLPKVVGIPLKNHVFSYYFVVAGLKMLVSTHLYMS